MKEGDGISQRTYEHHPQTTAWLWPEGRRARSGGGERSVCAGVWGHL